MSLTEKKQKLAALVKQAREYLDAGNMEAYNNADKEIDNLDAEIKAEEKQTAREAALKKIPDAQSKPSPEGNGKENITATAEYKDTFFRAVRGGRGALTTEDRQMFMNVMTISSDASAGFLVMPAEMETAIHDLLAANVAMRRLATVITATADRKIPVVTSYGAAAWIGENGSYPKVDDQFGVKTLGSHKLGKIILVSEELLNDTGYDLTGHINRSFSRAFEAAEEPGYLSGDGVDKPLGVLVDAQTGTTTASASAITSDELIDFFYSLKFGYRKNAGFLLNDATEKVLRKLKNGTTGDYMWQPGLTSGQPNTLLGRPIENDDYMPTIAASAKAIAFGDFKEYQIKDTKGMAMQVLDQLYAENGQVGFKGYERTDGKLITPEAVKLLVMHA